MIRHSHAGATKTNGPSAHVKCESAIRRHAVEPTRPTLRRVSVLEPLCSDPSRMPPKGARRTRHPHSGRPTCCHHLRQKRARAMASRWPHPRCQPPSSLPPNSMLGQPRHPPQKRIAAMSSIFNATREAAASKAEADNKAHPTSKLQNEKGPDAQARSMLRRLGSPIVLTGSRRATPAFQRMQMAEAHTRLPRPTVRS